MNSATPDYPWLCIEPYLADFAGARALSSAFELGLIDLLLEDVAPDAVAARLPLDERGLRLLLNMLRAHGVLDDGAHRLSAPFRAALAYRDLLEARLYFAHLVAPDFLHLSTALLAEPAEFFRRARLFELFSYDRCLEPSRENLERTARWMRITTALTRYEARACLQAFDFSGFRRQLDVGGNSGEFLLQLCRAHPGLHGTVYDLPVVADIGQAHVTAEGAQGVADRIGFVRARDRQEALPADHDLVSFKSMLHDWPDSDMHRFLARAHAALRPGGGLLIFERAPMEDTSCPLSYGQLPLLLFFRSYRNARSYREALDAAGFHDVQVQTLMLETPFHLISARKRA